MMQFTILLLVFLNSLFISNNTEVKVADYNLNAKQSIIKISGTSTLHDWTAQAISSEGSMTAELIDNKITLITESKISVPVKALKSDKEAMDKNMYEALKAKKHPQINFVLKHNSIANQTIEVEGEINIAGVSKTCKSTITQHVESNYIKVSGSIDLKMTDFKITPPEFLFGAFKTGDDVTISFELIFTK